MSEKPELFVRRHHQRIARLLECLDADLMVRHRCLFGGGTAIVLRFGEYRESRDVDFLVSSIDAYRELRAIVTTQGIAGLFTRPMTAPVKALRDARMDQYGIRTMLEVDGEPDEPIKFEIVLEGRIALDDPGPGDVIPGGAVRTLTTSDMITEKLLANSDRWADDSVHSRDLIDLAMMVPNGKIPPAAVAKASGAYASIEDDLKKAVERLAGRPGRLQECMAAMGMMGKTGTKGPTTTMSPAQLMDRIRKLRVPATSPSPSPTSAASPRRSRVRPR